MPLFPRAATSTSSVSHLRACVAHLALQRLPWSVSICPLAAVRPSGPSGPSRLALFSSDGVRVEGTLHRSRLRSSSLLVLFKNPSSADFDLLQRPVFCSCLHKTHPLHDSQPALHSPKDCMLAIKPWCWRQGDAAWLSAIALLGWILGQTNKN